MEQTTDEPVETVETSAVEEIQTGAVEKIQTRIAEKVREDSKNLARPTPADSLDALFTESDPQVDFAEMAKDDRYKDIQLVIAPGGTVYVFSETYLTPSEAGEKSLIEETQTRIAAKVREDSKLAQLTSLDGLAKLAPELEPDEPGIDFFSEMLQDERYQDIKTVTAATGTVYAYSETYITRNYADILARVEARNPGLTIAETVREESQVYPRPTQVELFKEIVFNIPPDELEACIAHTLKQPEFKDIKKLVASTGVCYLYSDLYMGEDKARSVVEWLEVERYANP